MAALTINVGTIDKRFNSTAHNFNYDKSYQVKLKANTSIIHPVFIVERNKVVKASGDFSKFNYLFCTNFERYYWIDDILYCGGRSGSSADFCELHCSVDVLASFENHIRATKAYVSFGPHLNDSTSGIVRPQQLDDPRFQPEVICTEDVESEGTTRTDVVKWATWYSGEYIPLDITGEGTILLTVTTSFLDGNRQGGVWTYMLTFSELLNIVNNLLDGILGDISSATDVLNLLSNAVINLFSGGDWAENVRRILWIPIARDDLKKYFSGKYSDMKMHIGPYIADSDDKYPRLNADDNYIIHKVGTYTINHPKPVANAKFLKYPKYTNYVLRHPNGSTDISCTALALATHVEIDEVFDAMTGDYSVVVRDEHDHNLVYGNVSGNISKDLSYFAGHSISGAQVLIGGTTKVAAQFAMGAFAPQESKTVTSGGAETIENSATGAKVTKTKEDTTQVTTSGIKGFSMPAVNAFSINLGNVGNAALNIYNAPYFGDDGGIIVLSALYCISTIPNICLASSSADLDDYEAYCNRYGYPFNNYATIQDLDKGQDSYNEYSEQYICCVGASVSLLRGSTSASGTSNPTKTEIGMLNDFLNSGFYLTKGK